MAHPARVLLVHGAWHGAWCWRDVVSALAARGVVAEALDLPGHGESQLPMDGLQGDAAHVRAALDESSRPVVLCGHSYGGCVITEAAAGHAAVRHLVYLAAFVPDVGESLLGIAQSDPTPLPIYRALATNAGGEFVIDPLHATPAFYGTCRPEVAAWATERLGPQAARALEETSTRSAWREKPSTYAVCTRDGAIAPSLQRRLAARCGRVLEWDSDHSPFLSRPGDVADLLAGLAREAGGT
jgi:pimeloyl-ACP methyl ester carboxylesterase